jgi:hypothetical protein
VFDGVTFHKRQVSNGPDPDFFKKPVHFKRVTDISGMYNTEYVAGYSILPEKIVTTHCLFMGRPLFLVHTILVVKLPGAVKADTYTETFF